MENKLFLVAVIIVALGLTTMAVIIAPADAAKSGTLKFCYPRDQNDNPPVNPGNLCFANKGACQKAQAADPKELGMCFKQ